MRPPRPPRPSPPDRSRKYHDRVAKQYDAMYEDAYWQLHDEVTWRMIKPHLPRDLSAKCCDLGCGTGKWGLKLLKSGYGVTLVDHSPGMIGKTREKLAEMPTARADRAATVVADIIDLRELADASFDLVLAMGDPLSICTDPPRAAAEMLRILKPGGVVIATADNKLAAADAYLARGDLDGLEAFVRSGRTRWVTSSAEEQFELTTFTPASLRKMFDRAGFEVIGIHGKTVLPIREHRAAIGDPGTLRRLVELEFELARDESIASRAAHLQITAKRPPAIL